MFVVIIIMISFPISKYFKNNLKKIKIIKNNLKENPQFLKGLLLGGRPDSNRRPPEPQSGVLTN